jgi:aldehyde:ferredoxin oxidoreductase
LGNYRELREAQKELEGGALYAVANKYQAMIHSVGLCSFSLIPGTYPVIEFISAVTGWNFTMEEALRTGHRIQTLRQAFIVREGISPNDFKMPERMSKTLAAGPLAGEARDFEALKSSFYHAMGWESQGGKAGHPQPKTLQALGLNELVG